MQSKQTCCVWIVAKLHGAECCCWLQYLRSFYFSNSTNASERKGLSAGKFSSSTAGLHLVLNTSCLRKKSCVVCYCMVECFHVMRIDMKHLHFRCEQYCIILPLRNKSFPQNLSSFCILGTRSLRFKTLRVEPWGLSFECQLTFEWYCILIFVNPWNDNKRFEKIILFFFHFPPDIWLYHLSPAVKKKHIILKFWRKQGNCVVYLYEKTKVSSYKCLRKKYNCQVNKKTLETTR